MIYIWDNGLSYSEWEMRFIETDEPREMVVKLLTLPGFYGAQPKIVGAAETIEWWEGGTVSLQKQLDPHFLTWMRLKFQGVVDEYRRPMFLTEEQVLELLRAAPLDFWKAMREVWASAPYHEENLDKIDDGLRMYEEALAKEQVRDG